MDILIKVNETINRYSMLSEGDCVLAGLSGGPDSVCLAVILDKLKKDFNLSLHAVYVDHGLRPEEVKGEKAFCKEFCDALGINFLCEQVDVKGHAKDKKLNRQEAARELRYWVFEEVARKINATKIALGHTASDQAETLLMMLLRGAGRKGLSGIPPVRKNIIRPLIDIERKEIEDFLAQNHGLRIANCELPYVTDSSNLKKDYFRNWIRLSVIPELSKKNPGLVHNICRTMDILREEDDYLEIIVTKTLMRLISRKSMDTIELFLSPLEILEKPVLRRVLRRAINETGGLRGIEFIHIEDVIKLIKKGKAGDRIYLPGGEKAVRNYSTLVITSKKPQKIPASVLKVPGDTRLSEVETVIKASVSESPDSGDGRTAAVFDADKTGTGLSVRARGKGDFFYPAGFGKRKKLQDFFVDEKVPRDERDSVPIVLSGDDIIWIAGYRPDERFKATDKTKKFLRLIISKK